MRNATDFALCFLIDANELGFRVTIFVAFEELHMQFCRITAFLYCRHFIHGLAPCRDSWELGKV